MTDARKQELEPVAQAFADFILALAKIEDLTKDDEQGEYFLRRVSDLSGMSEEDIDKLFEDTDGSLSPTL